MCRMLGTAIVFSLDEEWNNRVYKTKNVEL